MSAFTKRISNVLIFKDGAYWLTTEIWDYYPGGANDHNLHLMGYKGIPKDQWGYYGIDRDGFETAQEALSYQVYVKEMK